MFLPDLEARAVLKGFVLKLSALFA
jgi:hypothetical protein